MKEYLGAVCTECTAIREPLAAFDQTLTDLRKRFAPLHTAADKAEALDAESKQALAEAASEVDDAATAYEIDRDRLLADIQGFRARHAQALPKNNDAQRNACKRFDPIAERIRGLIRQVDLLYKLASRVADLGAGASSIESVADVYDPRFASKLVKQLDDERRAGVEQLKRAAYFHRQVAWLQERFPKAELEDVPGLVKLVDRSEINEANGWSLTPGRFVGVAPPEEDEDFDFEAALRDIHTELADLNKDAIELAAQIQRNFEELGA